MQEEIKIKQIRNPRRILCLGGPDSGVLTLLQDLTGAAPEPRSVPAHTSGSDNLQDDPSTSSAPRPALTTTVAGVSHALHLPTKYYTTTVPIWLDETSDPAAWKRDFVSPDAAEVVRAVGAWIVVFRDEKDGHARESAQQLMDGVRTAIGAAYGEEGEWDGVCLVVAMPPSLGSVGNKAGSAPTVEEIDAREDWEDVCWLAGFEYIEGWVKGEEAQQRNEAGELKGLARLREALEACEWEADGDTDDKMMSLEDTSASGMHAAAFGEETMGFGLERAQMEREFAGLKMALSGVEDENDDHNGEEEQVEELAQMMQRLQAVKDMSAGLPEHERRRLAARAVDDIMKDI